MDLVAARAVNDASPAATVRLARLALGAFNRRRAVVLGAAYRFDSEDTRNSPSLTLAALLRDSGADVIVHDPYVPARDANLARLGLSGHFTSDIESALDGRSVVFLATAHKVYRDLLPRLRRPSSGIEGVIDACNLYQAGDFGGTDVRYAGIGRGRRPRTAHWCAAWRSMAARWRVAWQMRWTPGAVPQPPLRRR